MGSPENTFDLECDAESAFGVEPELMPAPRPGSVGAALALLRLELRWFYVRMGGRVLVVGAAPAPMVAAASRIAGWLSELLPMHRGAFLVRYDGRRWPVRLLRQFGGLTSVVVRFAADAGGRAGTDGDAGGGRAGRRGRAAGGHRRGRRSGGLHAAHERSPWSQARKLRLLRRAAQELRARGGARLLRRARAARHAPSRPRGRAHEGPPDAPRASSPGPTLADLVPSPTIDEELVWFFNAQDGDFDSSSNFGRLLSSVADDGEWRTPEVHERAREKHRVIRSHLKSIPDHDAGVLQCAYAPRPWPVRLRKELGRLTGIVVRLSCTRRTWPVERPKQLATDAENAEMLHAMLRAGGEENVCVLRDLRREAQLEFARALGEYSLARRARSPWRAQ